MAFLTDRTACRLYFAHPCEIKITFCFSSSHFKALFASQNTLVLKQGNKNVTAVIFFNPFHPYYLWRMRFFSFHSVTYPLVFIKEEEKDIYVWDTAGYQVLKYLWGVFWTPHYKNTERRYWTCLGRSCCCLWDF